MVQVTRKVDASKVKEAHRLAREARSAADVAAAVSVAREAGLSLAGFNHRDEARACASAILAAARAWDVDARTGERIVEGPKVATPEAPVDERAHDEATRVRLLMEPDVCSVDRVIVAGSLYLVSSANGATCFALAYPDDAVVTVEPGDLTEGLVASARDFALLRRRGVKHAKVSGRSHGIVAYVVKLHDGRSGVVEICGDAVSFTATEAKS